MSQPSRVVWKQGRILDFSRTVFETICGDLRQGLCEVTVEAVKP